MAQEEGFWQLPLIDQICNYLFSHEFAHIKRRIDKIIEQHDRLMVQQKDERLFGFIHSGEAYRLQDAPVFNKHLRGLHGSLDGEMTAILKDRKTFENDQRKIHQALFKLIEPTSTNQAVRDALPECLIAAVPSLRELDRTNVAAYTIVGNERALKVYESALPLMETYCATKLLL